MARVGMRKRAGMLLVGVGALAVLPARAEPAAAPKLGAARRCPPEMARVKGFCIDRWEASMVDAATGRPLSPYYPPISSVLARLRAVWQVERRNLGDAGAVEMPLPDVPAWQEREPFRAKAVSRPGVVPQGYLTFQSARRACEAAGKRLCTEDEWVAACRGERDLKFPYGGNYVAGRCNVFRAMHPAAVLHGSASVGLTDPRLNLVVEEARDPLLRLTGATPGCVSRWGEDSLYDMVGNLDEWVDDPKGVFVGGFYARMTTKGCEAKISSHAPAYYDYSTGTRCCK